MSPISPTQLDFLARSPDAERASAEYLEQILHDRPGWITAAQLLQLIGEPDDDDTKRHIRHLAQLSPWVISGQKGYKHLEHATAEEIHHFVCWMESQAKQMTRRAETVRRNAHRIFG